jgi:hypothetical protein
MSIIAEQYLVYTGGVCVLGIQKSSAAAGMQILGDAFLRNNVVAYSKGNQTFGFYG